MQPQCQQAPNLPHVHLVGLARPAFLQDLPNCPCVLSLKHVQPYVAFRKAFHFIVQEGANLIRPDRLVSTDQALHLERQLKLHLVVQLLQAQLVGCHEI